MYPQGDVSTNPVIRMAGSVVLGSLDSRTELGFLRVNARFTVRGRRGLPLSAPQQVMMMSEEDQKRIAEYLATVSFKSGSRVRAQAGDFKALLPSR